MKLTRVMLHWGGGPPIVPHEVITEGVDRDQLARMAEQARDATRIR